MTARTSVKETIIVVEIDNPPVNALGRAVREAIAGAFDAAAADDALRGVLIAGVGSKAFSGGADIKEFSRPPAPPLLPDLLKRIESFEKPVMAAMNGLAFGGGLELALACDYRVAAPGATFALPEVRLGLIPGAGGTQRLPRLVGIRAAAEMIASGKPVDASHAEDMGLIDAVIDEDDFIEAALRDFLARLSSGNRPERRFGPASLPDEMRIWLDEFEVQTRKRARGQRSPVRALEAVRAASETDLAAGLKREREIFADCLNSDQRKALVHAFFGERAAGKHAFLKDHAPRSVREVAIVGAGTMGAGIAAAFAASGYGVKLHDRDPAALERGMKTVRGITQSALDKGRIDAAEAAARAGRVSAIAALEGIADADLVIEAVIERMDVKQEVFRAIAAIAKPGAVLATNTSYLDVNEIAAATPRPHDVVGMHFFSPAHVMKLLEVIHADKAALDAVSTALHVGKRLGKISVLAGVGDGFIGNRIFRRYRLQAECLVLDGAEPEDIDRAMREFGFPMGPFEVSDLAGLDIGWHNRRREDAFRDPAERYADIADRLYEAGRLGQKAGAGWYRYEGKAKSVDPTVKEIIAASRKESEASKTSFSGHEIRERLVMAMINEGARALDAGVARRAIDIDMVLLHGYGFPAYRGGPMFYADTEGLNRIVSRLNDLAQEDPVAFSPASILTKLAESGGKLADAEAGKPPAQSV